MTTLNENKDASQMSYNSEYSGVAIQERIQWCCHTRANTVVLPYNSEYSGVAIQQRIQWCCHTIANTVVVPYNSEYSGVVEYS